MTYDPMSSATFSPGSVSGLTPCAAPDGPTTVPSGPGPVPASPSVWRAPVLALTTLDISGRTGFGSSASDVLTRSLVSRLQARTRGSILFKLIWKVSALPSGRSICRLRASPGRTSVSDLSGWPTATTPSGGQTWPEGTSSTGRRPDGSKATVNLEQVAMLAGWPSPMAGTPARNGNNEAGNNDSSRKTTWLAGRATPTTSEGTGSAKGANKQGGETLRSQVALLGSTGSSVETPSSGLLSPEHFRWLQRLPAVWGSCAPTATLSTLKRRRSL